MLVKIDGFSYAAPMSPGYLVAFALAGGYKAAKAQEKPLHQLHVHFRWHTPDGTWGTGSCSLAEFLLWREGDVDKLTAAGLISPPAPAPRPKRWWQFWK